MTKKHFITLADYIIAVRVNCKFQGFTPPVLDHLARYLEIESPRFNRERWLDYIAGKCGPNGGNVVKK